jgi:dienelactone hydrolase
LFYCCGSLSDASLCRTRPYIGNTYQRQFDDDRPGGSGAHRLSIRPRHLLAATASAILTINAVVAAEFERIEIAAPVAAKGPFTAYLLRPAGSGPFPAIVALHGCGGLFTRKGEMQSREQDWARRLNAAGYAVLFPDSFTARGMSEICTVKDRTIHPKDRAGDAAAAAQWLAAQPFIDRSRMALLGWSNGGSTVLWAMRQGFMSGDADFKVAIAFYPGCRIFAQRSEWRPRAPLSLLIGAADDWTEPGPCRELARREGVSVIEYAGAYHGFDAPNSKVRVRTHLALAKNGTAHVGTHPEARAAAIEVVMGIFQKALTSP